MFFHTGTALQIGECLGQVIKESINKKIVVAHHYLQFRVDIDTDNPLPVGFFLDSVEGVEPWIHFKFERLGNFCFRCGWLSHVTGKCQFDQLLIIRAGTGVKARLYGPWIRSESPGSLLFINPSMNIGEQTQLGFKASQIGARGTALPNTLRLKDTLHQKLAELEVLESGNSSQSWIWKELEFENIKATCLELEALSITLKRCERDFEGELREVVLQKLKRPNYTIVGLTN